MAAKCSGALAYPARLDPEAEGGFTLSFPDFCTAEQPGGGGYTYGATANEALRRGADLLETIVATHMAEGWDLPKPSAARGRPLVQLEAVVAAKAELYRAMKAAGIGKEELARRIGLAPEKVDRLFSIHHAKRLDQLDAALSALGRRLVISTKAA